jgi:hypothetical protein
MPGVADSNSPVHWWNGRMYLYNSDGLPIRSEGEDMFSLRHARAVLFYSAENRNRWIESTWMDPDGVLFAWYHHEDFVQCGEGVYLSTPTIGALVSYDAGWTFHDFGNVLTAGGEPNCEAKNGYFAGGHGDFTVIADEAGEYLYFHFGNYSGEASQQGVAVARMRVEDRREPTGKVWKYFEGDWQQPGLGGEVTPIFPVAVDWGQANTDAFWGPSVHYNTALGKYVMLLNRACCAPGWPQEGVYVTYSDDLTPESWKKPTYLLDAGSWYPQVLGLRIGDTDKRAAEVARFFVGGLSTYELVFTPEAAPEP